MRTAVEYSFLEIDFLIVVDVGIKICCNIRIPVLSNWVLQFKGG